MFELLTKILLLLLFSGLAYFILLRFIPKPFYTWLGALVLVLFLVAAFLSPTSNTISEVWSLFSLPFRPLGLVIILLISSLRNWRKKTVSAPQVFAALLILLITSVPIIAYALTQQLERDLVGLAPPPTERAPVIVVLAQGTTQANLPPRTQVQLTGTGNRLLYTAQLYREQLAAGAPPTVVISAGARSDLAGKAEDISEARDAQAVLVNLGVPAERILTETSGEDLHTSAVRVKELLDKNKLEKRIVLVTSALQIRRARLAFAREGLTVIPRATDFYTIQSGGTASRRFQISDFLPSADALATTTRVIDEYLLSIYYFLRGWLAPISL